jgi:ribonuclease-3
LLLKRFPGADEGELAQRLAALVAEPTLVTVARGLDLGRHVKAAPGQDTAAVDAILADACEAIVGALYLDGGLDTARAFVATQWTAHVESATAPPKDAKSTLQEWAQGRGLPLPEYRETQRSGPDHAPRFTCSVTVLGHPPEIGTGKSKQIAETLAATAFLDRQSHGR